MVSFEGDPDDHFGAAVSVSGNVAIVGANLDDVLADADQGSAQVFRFDGSGWVPEAMLTASDGVPGDGFGISVCIEGDMAIVGASAADVLPNIDQGAAYVFKFNGSSWNQAQKLTATDGEAFDYYGWSVSFNGTEALIGARGDDIGSNADQGSVYGYHYTFGFWSWEQQLTDSDGAADDGFGYSVSVSGDGGLIGSPFDDVGSNSSQGSIHVWRFDGNMWNEEAKLTVLDGVADDNYGFSVSISGDAALAGAPYAEIGVNGNVGAAYVQRFDGSAWSEEAKLTASDGVADNQFGVAVSIDGTASVVGTLYGDITPLGDQGAAYVFRFNGSVWGEEAKLTAPDGANLDFFSGSVCVDGNTAMFGAALDDIGINNDTGSAYMFTFTPFATPTPTPSPTASPTASPTLSPTTSPTASPTTSPTASPTLSPTASPTASPTTSPTASPTLSPTASPTTSPTASPTASPTLSPTASPTASPTTSPTATPTVTATASPSPSPTASPTSSPTASPTASATPSPTASPTSSPTASPTATATASASPTTSPTSSPTASASPSPTMSPTFSPTESPTPSPSESPTPTESPTASPSPSATLSPTPSASPTPNAARDWSAYE